MPSRSTGNFSIQEKLFSSVRGFDEQIVFRRPRESNDLLPVGHGSNSLTSVAGPFDVGMHAELTTCARFTTAGQAHQCLTAGQSRLSRLVFASTRAELAAEPAPDGRDCDNRRQQLRQGENRDERLARAAARTELCQAPQRDLLAAVRVGFRCRALSALANRRSRSAANLRQLASPILHVTPG